MTNLFPSVLEFGCLRSGSQNGQVKTFLQATDLYPHMVERARELALWCLFLRVLVSLMKAPSLLNHFPMPNPQIYHLWGLQSQHGHFEETQTFRPEYCPPKFTFQHCQTPTFSALPCNILS